MNLFLDQKERDDGLLCFLLQLISQKCATQDDYVSAVKECNIPKNRTSALMPGELH